MSTGAKWSLPNAHLKSFEQLGQLVRTAVGFDEGRGDTVLCRKPALHGLLDGSR